MSTLQDVKRILKTLSPAERGQLLHWVAHDLEDSRRGIEASPDICGGAACIARTRIPVWTLEQYRRLGASEAELLRFYPSLCAEDLVNAWGYVRSHKDEIEQNIRENEAA